MLTNLELEDFKKDLELTLEANKLMLDIVDLAMRTPTCELLLIPMETLKSKRAKLELENRRCEFVLARIKEAGY